MAACRGIWPLFPCMNLLNTPVHKHRFIRFFHFMNRSVSSCGDKEKLFLLADFSYAPESDFLADVNQKASLYCQPKNAAGKVFNHPLKLWRNGIVMSSNQFQFLTRMELTSDENMKEFFTSNPGLLQDLVYLKNLQEIAENLCWESEVDYSITSCVFEMKGRDLNRESFVDVLGIDSAIVEPREDFLDMQCEIIKSEKNIEEILLHNTKFHYCEYETSPRPLEAICCHTLASLLIQLDKVHYICVGRERMNPVLIFLIGMTEHGRAVGLVSGSVET